jgi:hypothetical protein
MNNNNNNFVSNKQQKAKKKEISFICNQFLYSHSFLVNKIKFQNF